MIMSHYDINMRQFLLTMTRESYRSETLDRIHEPIELAIKSLIKSCDEIDESDPEAYQVILDDCNEEVDQLLGIAFVATQGVITGVRSAVARLSDSCNRHLGLKLSFTTDKRSLYRFAPDVREGITEIEAIDAVANYWKHNEEWEVEWDDGGLARWKHSGQNKRTIEIVKCLGVQPLATRNLGVAAENLGVKQQYDLSPLRIKVTSWAGRVISKAENELVQVS
jgi:hypothetical protein